MTGGSTDASPGGEPEHHYGNSVRIRDFETRKGPQKSYIDFQTSLPLGKIEEIYVYVHPKSSFRETPDYEEFHLQIWRPRDLGNKEFTLLWQQRAQVQRYHLKGSLHKVHICYLDTCKLCIRGVKVAMIFFDH